MSELQYAEYGFYLNDYLKGREAALNKSDFDFYAVKATKVIEQYTFGRVETVTDDVKNCCCELAENMQAEAKTSGRSGVTSERVGDYSVSYASAADERTERSAECRHILRLWLGSTGLLYRG